MERRHDAPCASDGPSQRQSLRDMLGYLNLSSGTPDPRFQRQLNELYRQFEAAGGAPRAPWREIARRLLAEAQLIRGEGGAFGDTEQAEAVIRLTFDKLLPAYRAFHRDLLYHQEDAALFRPFFLARAIEAVLQQGPPWVEEQRIVEGAIRKLNDFIGHRPVAVLNNDERMEPYPHEYVRPIPLYLRDAGVACGPYEAVVRQCLQILEQAPRQILRQADFFPEHLDELAVDPRAYDFDHPVNKRLAYQFGQWDPHLIDNRGYYRRLVLTEVTLDVLMTRVREGGDLPAEELLWEAGAVLAGVVLMAAAVSGSGPAAHDSSTTLATLLPRVANCRDQFYEQLLQSLSGAHGTRLRAEAQARLQPFAAARQHFNQCLARRRAAQQQHVCLARIFARMGYLEAARRQASLVAVPAARLETEIECHVAGGRQALRRGDLQSAMVQAREAEDLLHRAIQCGAMVDPWNILGFGGNFSLFPALENSVPDHRIEQLVRIVRSLCDLYARLESNAAAQGNAAVRRSASAALRKFADWWDRFATLEVSGVESFSGRDAAESAAHVARTLAAWQQGGAAAGNVAFWRQHVESFTSPKAYALVVEALLEQGDHLAAMALMMQWLSQIEQVALEDGSYSFNLLALRWMNQVRGDARLSPAQRWQHICKFLDYLEANAEDYWRPPRFAFARDEAPTEAEEDPFAAAYEGVIYRDSTDRDEGEVLDGGKTTEFELESESQRLIERLSFLGAVAELWQIAALAASELAADAQQAEPARAGAAASAEPPRAAEAPPLPPDVAARLDAWQQQALHNRLGLLRLLTEVRDYAIPEPSGSRDSLVEFDRRQGIKEFLLEHIIKTAILAASASRALAVAGASTGLANQADWEQQAVVVLRGLRARNAAAVRETFPTLRMLLSRHPLLHVPVSRGGDAERVLAARLLLDLLVQLLRGLPRLGMLLETCQLLTTARQMEAIPVGPRSVTEFEQLFTVACQGMVEALVVSAAHAEAQGRSNCDEVLIDHLKSLMEKLLRLWRAHSDGLRLSPIEPLIIDEARWKETVEFVERYGHDLFVPRFLNEGNLRGILHHGVANWLRQVRDNPLDEGNPLLIESLDREIPLDKAAEILERIIQVLLECAAEYGDYNHTTTQSDRGEKLYILLDFLRLKTHYDRVAWRLKPVVLAHEVLVRRNRTESAELWRRSLAEQISTHADHMLLQYDALTRKYGMRLPTVGDRLRERFVRPLEIDCLRALIPPALEELESGRPARSFEVLEQAVAEQAQSPVGVGLDVPAWLTSLEDEVKRAQAQSQPQFLHRHLQGPDFVPLDDDDLQQQIEEIKIAP